MKTITISVMAVREVSVYPSEPVMSYLYIHKVQVVYDYADGCKVAKKTACREHAVDASAELGAGFELGCWCNF